jgi:hypothetical protein
MDLRTKNTVGSDSEYIDNNLSYFRLVTDTLTAARKLLQYMSIDGIVKWVLANDDLMNTATESLPTIIPAWVAASFKGTSKSAVTMIVNEWHSRERVWASIIAATWVADIEDGTRCYVCKNTCTSTGVGVTTCECACVIHRTCFAALAALENLRYKGPPRCIACTQTLNRVLKFEFPLTGPEISYMMFSPLQPAPEVSITWLGHGVSSLVTVRNPHLLHSEEIQFFHRVGTILADDRFVNNGLHQADVMLLAPNPAFMRGPTSLEPAKKKGKKNGSDNEHYLNDRRLPSRDYEYAQALRCAYASFCVCMPMKDHWVYVYVAYNGTEGPQAYVYNPLPKCYDSAWVGAAIARVCMPTLKGTTEPQGKLKIHYMRSGYEQSDIYVCGLVCSCIMLLVNAGLVDMTETDHTSRKSLQRVNFDEPKLWKFYAELVTYFSTRLDLRNMPPLHGLPPFIVSTDSPASMATIMGSNSQRNQSKPPSYRTPLPPYTLLPVPRRQTRSTDTHTVETLTLKPPRNKTRDSNSYVPMMSKLEAGRPTMKAWGKWNAKGNTVQKARNELRGHGKPAQHMEETWTWFTGEHDEPYSPPSAK